MLTTQSAVHNVKFAVDAEKALAAGFVQQGTADLRRFRNSKDAVGCEITTTPVAGS
jgi:hypothetical protein